jgi:Nucleoside-diphosphate-sugar epimerases
MAGCASPVTADFYRGRSVLVTGGLGFIGSTLARRLSVLGADVHVVDGVIHDTGWNRFNLADSDVRVHAADVRDAYALKPLVRGRSVIFHCAGQVSHLDSMCAPFADLDANCGTTLQLLESCKQHNPEATIVLAGTRQVYGRPQCLPVNETHRVNPTDINGVHKAAAEFYALVYHHAFGLPTTVLRLTNVYGPRQLIRHPRQGVLGWLIGQAVQGHPLQLFGDGGQVRDMVYVDDAVDAFLRAGAEAACVGGVFNVGSDRAVTLKSFAHALIEVVGHGQVEYVEWPADRQAIDVGSVVLDSSKFRYTTGWTQIVSLDDGLRETVAYYRRHFSHYL